MATVVEMASDEHLMKDPVQVHEAGGPGRVMKDIVRELQAPKKISHVEFGLMSSTDIARASHIEVYNRELYKPPTRIPFPHGTLDPRMGISDKSRHCETCGQKLADCAGHYGHVQLVLPVFHVGFFRPTIAILQSICKGCSRILLEDGERRDLLQKMRNPRLDVLQRRALTKKIWEKCKKCTKCPYCEDVQGVVKKVGALRIVHEKYNTKNKTSEANTATFHEEFDAAIEANKDVHQFLNKAQDHINPLRALNLFKAIIPEDIELLDMDPTVGQPERLLTTHILVPPACIRPSVCTDASMGSNEDDLTMTLRKIVHINRVLADEMEKGANVPMLLEGWEVLQTTCALYINSEVPGLQNAEKGKPVRSFCQRLKGKSGRFRGNLSGKRVDFSARTVISPDPNVDINQVVVPLAVAKTLTYPERVNAQNMEKLRQLIINGPEVHPGARFVEFPDGGKKYLQYGDRSSVAKDLKIGSVVERHLEDGDVVLFNRQPSLHKMSIMSHKAKIMPWRTFRFNECVCNPYNADFDGDEMNLHVPQTEEARGEALELMGVLNNLVTPRNGEILISATQDFLTGAYLMSRKDYFLDRSQFAMACCSLLDANEHVDLPPPAIIKPVELWTGKQIFSVLVRPNRDAEVFVNLEVKNKSYTKDLHMCPSDGYICFRNSELLSGSLDKAVLGSGTKQSLFYVILRDYSPQYAARCLSRLAKGTSRWLMNFGFSIGISDVTPSDRVVSRKGELLDAGYAKCADYIEQYKTGRLVPKAGCNEEQTVEHVINGTLSEIREDAGRMCISELHWLNSPLIMAICGSKGSTINISQMVACVGQQTVSGSRVPNGFVHRSLPHFDMHDRSPAAKGFVQNSFRSGMNATEFFFHTMGGREGLVDTAVKTAETGYMQRRLMKALEDLSTQYDNTVRNSRGGIVQFTYGDDGLDPVCMEGKDGRPVNFERLMLHIRSVPKLREGNILKPDESMQYVRKRLADRDHQICSAMYAEELLAFFNKEVKAMVETRRYLGLEDAKGTPEKWLVAAAGRVNSLTKAQLDAFLKLCLQRYIRAQTEPGTAVGAIGAQSIGEPGTQMTLKTFHFAGVASMNITLGVPRIKEIINAAKSISTPIITATLVTDSDVKSARIVKGRIEQTMLGEVAEYIKEVYCKGHCYISIKLDRKAISALQLDITASSVKSKILQSKLKIPEVNIRPFDNRDRIHVFPIDKSREKMWYSMQFLTTKLPSVIVKGIPEVSRAVINSVAGDKYNLLVEGTDLASVMATPGVDGTKTSSNHIIEVEKVLGVEAGRKTIIDEIQYTMGQHGMSIDARHVMLLADVMTYRGEILGITRFGISKMNFSVMMLASFEKTTDHLFDAAVHARKDAITGVSECIIMGIPVPLGTGLFKLLQKTKMEAPPKRKPLLLDSYQHRLDITQAL